MSYREYEPIISQDVATTSGVAYVASIYLKSATNR